MLLRIKLDRVKQSRVIRCTVQRRCTRKMAYRANEHSAQMPDRQLCTIFCCAESAYGCDVLTYVIALWSSANQWDQSREGRCVARASDLSAQLISEVDLMGSVWSLMRLITGKEAVECGLKRPWPSLPKCFDITSIQRLSQSHTFPTMNSTLYEM